MVSTRSSTKQIVTRSNASGKAIEFMELPQRQVRKQRKTKAVSDVTSSSDDLTTEQSNGSDSDYIDDPDEFSTIYSDSVFESDSASVMTTDSFLDIIVNREYEVAIDFDDAHDSWMANKKRTANGNYVYICGYTLSNHKLCQRACCDKIGIYSGCKTHYMWEEKIHKGCFV